ncbi:unnamed protein product [Calypogeia fissa]
MSSLVASPPSALATATSPKHESPPLPMASTSGRSGGGSRRFACSRIAHSPRAPQPLPGGTIPSTVGGDGNENLSPSRKFRREPPFDLVRELASASSERDILKNAVEQDHEVRVVKEFNDESKAPARELSDYAWRIAYSPPAAHVGSIGGIDQLGGDDHAIAPPRQAGADGDEVAMRGLLGSSLLSANSLSTKHLAVGAAAGVTTAPSTQPNSPSPIQNSPVVATPPQLNAPSPIQNSPTVAIPSPQLTAPSPIQNSPTVTSPSPQLNAPSPIQNTPTVASPSPQLPAPSPIQSSPTVASPSPQLTAPSPIQNNPTVSTPSPQLNAPSPIQNSPPVATPSSQLNAPSPIQISPVVTTPSPQLNAPSPIQSSPTVASPSPQLNAPSPIQSSPTVASPSPQLYAPSPIQNSPVGPSPQLNAPSPIQNSPVSPSPQLNAPSPIQSSPIGPSPQLNAPSPIQSPNPVVATPSPQLNAPSPIQSSPTVASPSPQPNAPSPIQNSPVGPSPQLNAPSPIANSPAIASPSPQLNVPSPIQNSPVGPSPQLNAPSPIQISPVSPSPQLNAPSPIQSSPIGPSPQLNAPSPIQNNPGVATPSPQLNAPSPIQSSPTVASPSPQPNAPSPIQNSPVGPSPQLNAPSPIQNSPILGSPQQSKTPSPGQTIAPSAQLQSNGPSLAPLAPISSSGAGGGSVAIIGSVVAVVVVLALVGIIGVYLAKRNPKSKLWSCFGYRARSTIVRSYSTINEDWKSAGAGSGANSVSQHPEPSKVFTYNELKDATSGFSPSNLLGEGGFGQVYKGTIDGNLVAVKMLKIWSKQGETQFRAEVDIISRVHHRHLVSLVGYCISDNHRLLVYKFVPNGTLEEALHGEGKPCMNWATRMKIALGTARGLAYLHGDCIPRIIHRDIKGSNILLDEQFEAQVADFGLAKLADATQTHLTTRVMGTFGYVAPEYAMSGKLTDKSDVYSFGVVLLELITGKRPVDSTLLSVEGDSSLVEWARPLLTRALETRDVSAVVDPNLKGMYDDEEMFRMVEVAATCVRHSSPKRPKMVEALRGLVAQDGDLHQGVLAGYSKEFIAMEANEQMREFRKAIYSSSTTQSSSATKSSGRGNIQSTSSNEFGSSSQELHPVTRAPILDLIEMV